MEFPARGVSEAIANAFPYVSTEEEARLGQLEEHFEVLQHERWFEGAVRKLEQQFQNRPEWAEDAVATAFERAVQREMVFPSVDELKKWMYVVAFNDMRRRAKREAGRPLPPWELERGDTRSAEDEALEEIYADDLYEELRERIKRWPSERRRVVALFVVETERLGEPSSGQDIIEHVADVLGIDISLSAAWRLKRQVLARLMDEVTGAETPEDEEDEDED